MKKDRFYLFIAIVLFGLSLAHFASTYYLFAGINFLLGITTLLNYFGLFEFSLLSYLTSKNINS